MFTSTRLLFSVAASILLAFSQPAMAAKPSKPAQIQRTYTDRADVEIFINEMVEKHQFVATDLKMLFSKAHYLNFVPKLMNPAPPGFKRSWAVYRARFTDPLRVREGIKFWNLHSKTVKEASEKYGVPEEIIIGIIGVETIYGRITGDVRVIDALSTLAFDYPRRAEYFRSELENYLLFARENKFDLFEVRGSFAGAIGIPQFMPGSIRRYATDFNGDGIIDLRNSPEDAIGSVAKFLADHGWERGAPTHYAASLLKQEDQNQSAEIANLIIAGLTPKFTKSEIENAGLSSATAPQSDRKYALIDLPNGDNPTSYYLGPQNFFVITRYNRSSFYAMAVIELGQIIKSTSGR